MRLLILILAMLVPACSVPTDEAPAKKAAPPRVEKPADLSHRFPKKDRVSFEIVDNHMLGKDFLPGGNLAEYESGGKKYQRFVIETKSPDAAALLAFDYKKAMTDAKFIAHMGGYYGMDGGKPVLVFPKTKYLVGIVNLPEKEADLAGRNQAGLLE